jgi:hypothetical protein
VNRRGARGVLIVAALAAICACLSWPPAHSEAAPFIDPGLLPAKAARGGPILGLADDPALDRRGWVRCQIELETPPGDPEALREWFLQTLPEGRWEGRWGRWLQVSCPSAAVERLAACPGAVVIARPPCAIPMEVSEGADLIRAPEFRERGYGGQGVRVAVIDVGFLGYEALLGVDLPARVTARSFYSSGGDVDLTGGNQKHGTGVAEIVHDVAPGADLLLANAGTLVELGRAVEWALDQGADVINHSVGWFVGPGNGTGEVADIARMALGGQLRGEPLAAGLRRRRRRRLSRMERRPRRTPLPWARVQESDDRADPPLEPVARVDGSVDRH